MKILRFSAVFLCLISLGLWGLYTQRLALTERVLVDRLSKIGCTDSTITIESLGLDTVSISSFHTSFPDGPLQHVNLTDLVLHFTLSEFIKGSVKAVSLESLHLQIAPRQTVQSEKPVLPFATLRQYIPQDIFIKSLTVTAPDTDINLDMPFQVHLKNVEEQPLAVNITFDSEKCTIREWEFTNVKGNISFSTEDAEKVIIEDSSIFRFGNVANSQTSARDSLFAFSAQLQKDSETDAWQLLQSNIHATVAEIQHGEIRLHPSPVTLEIQGQTLPLELRVELIGDELRIQQSEKQFILQKIHSSLLADTKDIDLKIQFIPEIAPVLIQTTIKHKLSQGLGTANISTRQALNIHEQSDSVQKLLQSFNPLLSLNDGLINAKSSIHWNKNKLQDIQASFKLRDGAGNYGKTLFNGLVIQQDLQLFPSIKTHSSGYISASQIFNGITLKNFSLHNLLLEKTDSTFPNLLIESIQTELFGGIVNGNQILINPDNPAIDTKIHFNRIDLQEIVKLSNVKGLSVTGILDGTVQLIMKNNEISVPNGEIHSRAPGGTIHYFPPGGSAHYSTLPAYALKALEEFNYSILTATPTYSADGTLIIAIHTEGHSPPLETERPVHLNLNTEQNILSLLESLRYSNKLTDKLEQQLQTTRKH